MARVYVAGKFEEIEAVRKAQAALRAAGHEITHDWTGENPGDRKGEELQDFLKDCAVGDYQGVLHADVVLLLNHERAFGAMVETGLAIAWGRTVYVVGAGIRDNIFFHLPDDMGIRLCDSMEDAVAAITADEVVDARF